MPTRSPAPTHGGPKGPAPNAPKVGPKATPTGTEAQPPLLEDVPDGPQARHAALLDGAKLGRGVGEGQQRQLFLALQRTHGNAHASGVVAQLKALEAARRNGNGTAHPPPTVQLQPAAACPAPPAPPEPVAPQEDPNFQAVEGQIKKEAKGLRRHDPAKKKVAEAQDAAKPPSDDVDTRAKAAKTEKMGTAKPGTFDKAAFMAAVRQAIAAKAPKNLDEADKFASSNNADVKSEVTGKVNQGKEGAAKDVKQKAEEPPDPSKVKPKEVKPFVEEKPGPRPPDPAAAKAMPRPAPPEQKDLGAGKCETDSQMEQAGVTEEQLAKSNEPEFTDALAAKKEGEEHSAQAPRQVEQMEKTELEGARKVATGDAKGAITHMFGARQTATGKVGAGKSTAKAKEEAERARVSGEIKAIYDRTEKDVKGILDGLDQKVDSIFDRGEAEAKRAFTQQHETEMEAYKDERYSGFWGWERWLEDKWAGLPEEANQIYIRARDQVYLPRMDKVISDVADTVGAELTKAKQRIDKGRDEINEYVSSLPTNLKKFGAEAQKELSSKFEDLEQSVNDKQKELVDSLATKYAEAQEKVNDEIKEMQEANKGLWDKVKDAVVGVIRTILQLKDMLLNVLARAAGVIGKIIGDPIGFLGNLVGAVKDGIVGFKDRIEEHLKGGLMGWLFGELGKTGIEMPESFDIKGILALILSLLGLTKTAILNRIMQRLGRMGSAVIGKLQEAFDFFKVLASEGLGGLWKFIKDKVGSLKKKILDPIKDLVITKVIVAGVTWLVSMLNPASAFIKACKGIYDIVMFFFSRASQIGDFFNSILDSVGAIASGAVSAAASLIEKTLARALPLVISFLASLLNLGDIGDKIRKIFDTIQKPIMKAVDFVINPIVKFGKKLWGKLKGFFRKKRKEDPEHARKLAAGLAAIDEAERARLKDGKISRADAEEVARTVKTDHKVFKSIKVVDAGRTWDYDYVASPGKRKTGEQKAEEIDAEVEAILQRAKREEPAATSLVNQLARANNGRMAGRAYRLKTKKSLSEKLERDLTALPMKTVKHIGAEISDALRYTIVLPVDTYKEGHDAVLAGLRAAGHTIVSDPLTGELKDKNFWKKIGTYKGYNTQLVSPGGQRWELQFHTRGSYEFKGRKTHKEYEELRDPNTSEERRRELVTYLTKRASRLKVPPGVLD